MHATPGSVIVQGAPRSHRASFVSGRHSLGRLRHQSLRCPRLGSHARSERICTRADVIWIRLGAAAKPKSKACHHHCYTYRRLHKCSLQNFSATEQILDKILSAEYRTTRAKAERRAATVILHSDAGVDKLGRRIRRPNALTRFHPVAAPSYVEEYFRVRDQVLNGEDTFHKNDERKEQCQLRYGA